MLTDLVHNLFLTRKEEEKIKICLAVSNLSSLYVYTYMYIYNNSGGSINNSADGLFRVAS